MKKVAMFTRIFGFATDITGCCTVAVKRLNREKRRPLEAFEQVYEFYFKDVYKYVYVLCRNPDEAEEITQETFYQAMKGMASFRGDCKMFVWLCQIAKHVYFARLRKRKRAAGQSAEDALEQRPDLSQEASVEQRFLDEADAMRLHRYLHRLDEPYKEVFMLRVFGELSFKKIAQIFEKTESWARVCYHRAKVRLITGMEENDGKDCL